MKIIPDFGLKRIYIQDVYNLRALKQRYKEKNCLKQFFPGLFYVFSAQLTGNHVFIYRRFTDKVPQRRARIVQYRNPNTLESSALAFGVSRSEALEFHLSIGRIV